MTDNEIIKALECCSDNEYYCDEDCPFYVCCSQADMAKCSLDLINRQKEEIERLKSMNQAKLDTIHDLQAEIEIERLRYYPYTTQVEVSKKLESQIKSEAITEFAERLKDIYKVHDGLHLTIDNLVKEMVGDNND